MNGLTQERLKELLRYDPKTGLFIWIVDRGGFAKAGTVAGSPNNEGYIQIRVDRVLYKAHRLAWLYMKGAHPPAEVDHRNRKRADNRWRNLRLASESEQAFNRTPRKNQATPVVGVRQRESGRYIVRIQAEGKRVCIGTFDTLAEATRQRKLAEMLHHGAFGARG